MAQQLIQFLLAEDDDDHADLIMRNLKRHQVLNHVERVVDGVDVMNYLTRQGRYENSPRPDVILLDLNMPRMNGHEALSRIKSDPTLECIPVVILTTSDAEVDRAKAYKHHANSYLVKPIDFAQLSKMVHDLGIYWGLWNQRP